MKNIYLKFWVLTFCMFWGFESFGQYEEVISNPDSSFLFGFGSSIAVEGNRALIGNPEAHSTGQHTGIVYYYEYDGSGWVLKQTLTEDGLNDYVRYGISVALDGDWALIGVRDGGAYFYHFENGQWRLHQSIIPDFQEYSNFGGNVAIQNGRAIITDAFSSLANQNAGAAFFYELVDNIWTQKQIIVPSDSSRYGRIGNNLSLYGDWMVIGANHWGYIYIYQYNGVQWEERQVFRTRPGQIISAYSISLYEDWMIIGDDKTQIFKRINNRYELFQELDTPRHASQSTNIRVGINDRFLAIGNPFTNDRSGSVYVYQYNGDKWGNQKQLGLEGTPGLGGTITVNGSQIWSTALWEYNVYMFKQSQQYFISNTSSNGPGSIYHEISQAPPGSEILFDTSLDGDTIRLANGPIHISKNLRLIVPQGKVMLDGEGLHRIFEIDSTAEVYLEGLTFQYGKSNIGGSILNRGSLELVSCTFHQNEAVNGAALANTGTLCVEASTFYENKAEQKGGAIWQVSGISNLKNSSFTLNSAILGGAHFIDTTTHINIHSCTIGNNSSVESGGGVYNLGQMSIRNSILGSNIAPVHADIYTQNPIFSHGYNLLGEIDSDDFSNLQPTDIWGNSSQPVNPLLGNLKNNQGPTLTLGLRSGSPAIDKGNVDSLIYDQRHILRSNPTDIGAVDGVLYCDDAPNLVNTHLDSGPGSLRQIIEEAQAGDTIRFSECMRTDTIYLTEGDIHIDKDLNIIGPGSEKLSINAHFLNRIFAIGDSIRVNINGLSLLNGHIGRTSDHTSFGGAIYQGESTILNIKDCVFLGNTAHNAGGAIYGQGELSLDSCQFIGNGHISETERGTQYGVIHHPNIRINNCLFKDNYTGRGTVVHSPTYDILSQNPQKCIIRNSTIAENQGNSGHGQIIHFEGDLIIDNSTFWNNGKRSFLFYHQSMINNLYTGGVTILNSTFAFNKIGILFLRGYLTMGNTILAHNHSNLKLTPTDSDGKIYPIKSLGGNFIDLLKDENFPTDITSDILGTLSNPLNPLLDSVLRDNGGPTPTLALLMGSPAIDKGISALREFDQRGMPRVGRSDIGAYELGCIPGEISSTADAGPGSLRQAILDAQEGDTLRFSGCFFNDTIVLDRTIEIDKSISIIPDELGQIVLKGASQFSLLHIMEGNELYLKNISFSNAQANTGASIYNEGDVIIENGTWSYMEADTGGAIYNAPTASLELKNAQIENTYAIQGGAIWNEGEMHIEKSSFNQIKAEKGGVIYNQGSLAVRTTTLSSSKAKYGGAIFNSSHLQLINSTFAHDTARFGGGIYQENGQLELSNVTVGHNYADSLGGGIFVAEGSTLSSQNSLIGSNIAVDNPDIHLGGNWLSQGYNLIGILSNNHIDPDSTDIIGTTNSPIDPQLDSLKDNGGFGKTMALTACSPAADQGKTAESFDQRGIPRNNPSDIGAFEGELGFEGEGLVLNTNWEGPGSFRNTIENANPGDTIRFHPCLNGRNIYLGDPEITIEKNLTIIGDELNPPFLIAENANNSMFDIGYRDTVLFQHINLGGKAGQVYDNSFLINYGSCLFQSCKIQDYSTDRFSIISNIGNLVVTNCSIQNLRTNSSIGAFRNNARTYSIFDSCTFIGNHSLYAMIYNDYLSKSEMTDCFVQNHIGGFLENYGFTDISRSRFESNTPLSNAFINNIKHINIDTSIFKNIESRHNGGVICSSDSLIIKHSQFIENGFGSREGGAIYNWGNSWISDSDFIGNSAEYGGAIMHEDSTLHLKNCNFISNGLIDENTHAQEGGAVRVKGQIIIDACYFEGNEAEKGSAIFSFRDNDNPYYLQSIQSSSFGNHGIGGEGVIQTQRDLTINNSTIYASGIPAIKNESNREILITNSTISRNEAGINNHGNLRLQNTIIADNYEADLNSTNGRYYSNGHNLIGNIDNTNFPTQSTDLIGTNQNPIDPFLANPSRGNFFTSTMALLPGSPAINAGDGGDELFDQRGMPRDAMPDIGAYEFAATNECTFTRWEARDQTMCNDTTGFYQQEILIQYLNPPDSGQLIVELSSLTQTDTLILPIESNTINFELTIPLGSGSWDIAGYFTDSVQCNFVQTDFFTALEVCTQPEPIPLYRINAGGIEMTDSLMNWDIDKQNNPSPYVNSSGSNNTTGWDGDQSIENNTSAPTKLFGTNRWDGSWGDEMKWGFPLTNGDYIVNLYFAEIKSNSSSIGARVFDISVENQMAFDDLDVFAEVGYKVALQKSIHVDVSDGVLNVDFQRVSGDPMLSGIEVLGFENVQRQGLASDKFNLYPNPAQDIFTLESSIRGEALITIRNMAGQEVFKSTRTLTSSQEISITHLAEGVYQVEIKIDDQTAHLRFIKGF